MRADEEQSTSESYSRSVGYGALTFFPVMVIGLVSSVITTRLYGITVVGEFAIVLAALSALSTLSTVREQSGFVRRVVGVPRRSPELSGLFAALLSFSTLLTVVASAAIALATKLLLDGPVDQPHLFVPVVAIFAAYAVLMNPAWNMDMVLSAYRGGRELFILRTHLGLSFMLLSFVGWLIWDSVWGLVAATIASWVTSGLHRLVLARRFVRLAVGVADFRQGLRALPDMIRFGLKVTPGVLAEAVSLQAGTWVVAMIERVAAVGAFTRSWTVAGAPLIAVRERVAEMLFPTLVERRRTGDSAGFDRALVDSVRYFALIMLLMAAATGGAGAGCMLIFGRDFEIAGNSFAIILLVVTTSGVAHLQTVALWAHDRPWLGTAISAIRTVVVLASIVPLTQHFGITGTAAALLAGNALAVVVTSVLMARQLSSRLTALWSRRQLVALPLAYVAGFVVSRQTYETRSDLLSLPPAVAAGTVAFVATVVLVGGRNKRDEQRIRSVALSVRGAIRRRG